MHRSARRPPSSSANNPRLRVEDSGQDALAALRQEIDALRRAVTKGELAPKAITQGLDRLAALVQALALSLSHGPGARGIAEVEAGAIVAQLLTPREREVAAAVLRHGTSARAAHALGMSQSTLGHHRSNILRKLGASSFAQMASLIAAPIVSAAGDAEGSG